ncbi:MAG TPA: hypothetical protein VF173_15705 [Thermoanaerobaculia bacterium]|nr:hypothetical protein [Thermoanaerobaculia bacterium]
MTNRFRVSLAFAVAGLLALACFGATPVFPGHPRRPKPGSGNVAFETLVQRSIPGQQGDQVRQVVRDASAWKDNWFRLRERDSGTLPHQEPRVDFSKDMVIVAAMPTQSCISKVTVQQIVHNPGEVVVTLLEAPPAVNCVCIVSQRPVHVVRLPKTADPVRFEAVRGVTPCGR